MPLREQTGIDFKKIKTDEEARQLAAEKHVKYENGGQRVIF